MKSDRPGMGAGGFGGATEGAGGFGMKGDAGTGFGGVSNGSRDLEVVQNYSL